MDARLGLAARNGRRNVMRADRNLIDELTRSFGNDGLGGPSMTGSDFRFVGPPSSVAVPGNMRC